MRRVKEEKTVIDIVKNTYQRSCRIIEQYYYNNIYVSEKELRQAEMCKERIHSELKYLSEMNYLFIKNEIIDGKSGNWYQGLMSTPTYYRNRKKAYATFIKNLED